MTRITTTITTDVDIDLDIPTAAKWFSSLSDDEMAKFICACAKEMESWPGSAGESMMWHVGRHLATCECSTSAGRDLIRGIARSMEWSLAREDEHD